MDEVKLYPGTNQDIEGIADRLRAKIVERIDNEDLSSAEFLRELVRRTGGRITVVDDPSDQEVDGGSLVISGERNYTIYLSPYTTPLRDNFTIAHEVGHYILHFYGAKPRPSVPIGFARYGTAPLEWQANRFAAALLMPSNRFQQAFLNCGGDLLLLSGMFDVSFPAVEVRAKSLGLAGEV